MNYSPLQLIPPPPPTPFDIAPYPSALAFDPYADLLYVGDTGGTIASYCSPLALSRYVSYSAHGARWSGGFGGGTHLGMGGGVKEIRVTDREITALGEGGIGGRKRSGMPRWRVDDPTHGLRTFTTNPVNSHEILAGGAGAQMYLVNTSRGEIVKTLDQPHALLQLASVKTSAVSASPAGHIQLLDPRREFKANNTISSASTFNGGLTGMDVLDNVVVAWGWNAVQGQPVPDPLIKLFDIRTLKPLPSLSFLPGASLAKLHPGAHGKIIAASAQGYFQILDMHRPTDFSEPCQLELSTYLSCMAISAQGDYLAFGDADGQVHMWTSHDVSENSPNIGHDGTLQLPPMNGYQGGIEVEWPDVPAPMPEIQWKDNTPLNMIGMPYYDQPLISNFTPSEYVTSSSPLFNPPPEIPASVLSTMRLIDGVGYAPLPVELKGTRNVVTKRASENLMINAKGKFMGVGGKGKSAQTGRRESGPRFRSERDRDGHTETVEDDISALNIEGESGVDPKIMPKYYRKVEIKYSRFGVEDFDFAFYNKTQYSGLETHIINSYTNSVLQALHYTLPIRACAKAHIATECAKEHCLLCESGFLFKMLEDAKGINCQASNFSRAFSSTLQARTLGLFVSDEETFKINHSEIIQKFNRWLLSTYNAEDAVTSRGFSLERGAGALTASPASSPFSQVASIQARSVTTCLSCGRTTDRDAAVNVVDLLYPRKALSNEAPVPMDFGSILKASIIRETTAKATCPFCRNNVILHTKRILSRDPGRTALLPPVLSVNASILTPDHRNLWKSKSLPGQLGIHHFLPEHIRVRVSDVGDIEVEEDRSEDVRLDAGDIVYKIRSIVAHVESEAGDSHLVSLVRMPSETGERDGQWMIFNDFLVRPVTQSEALNFSGPWKSPCMLVLERVDSMHILDLEVMPTSVDPSILFKDVSISWRRQPNRIMHTLLTPGELPKKGTLISIDAEFVALQQEEVEIRSDGTRKVLRPSKMSLARVSVLRGQGESENKPFIDDYIHIGERIQDYLTEYSGIKDGDLDPQISPHTMVPLKVAYKKLRLLVDLGCVFIGHGLSKDFRTINLFVPPDQVIDTVNIYYDPARHRKLSLRFLSWFLLKQDIQLAEHDSIEDARSALLLYKLYLKFVEENRFEDVMEDIFEAGKRLGFKPPSREPQEAPTPPAPSAPLPTSRTPDLSHVRQQLNYSPMGHSFSSGTGPPRHHMQTPHQGSPSQWIQGYGNAPGMPQAAPSSDRRRWR